MPFLPYLDEEEKKKQDQTPNISGASTSFNNEPPGSEKQLKGEPTSSGQYTNINKYIDANQDQAQQMGTKLTSQVEQQAEDAKQDIQGLQQQTVKPTSLNPSQYLENPLETDVNEYNMLKATGGYEGPEDISEIKGIDKAGRKAQKAQEQVQLLGSEGGVSTLLNEQYRRPDYSQGELSLDNVLVRNNEQNVNQMNNLQEKYSNINSLFDQTNTRLGNSISEAKGQALENRKKFAPAERAAFESLLDPIQGRIDEYNANRDLKISEIQGDFSNNKLNQDTIDYLGLNMDELSSLLGLNPQNYLNQNSSDPTYNDLATDEERAKYAALAQLAGDETRTQIGSEGREISPISFDMEKFLQDKERVRTEELNRYSKEELPRLQQQASGIIGSPDADLEFLKNADSNTPFNELASAVQRLKSKYPNTMKGVGDQYLQWASDYQDKINSSFGKE